MKYIFSLYLLNYVIPTDNIFSTHWVSYCFSRCAEVRWDVMIMINECAENTSFQDGDWQEGVKIRGSMCTQDIRVYKGSCFYV